MPHGAVHPVLVQQLLISRSRLAKNFAVVYVTQRDDALSTLTRNCGAGGGDACVIAAPIIVRISTNAFMSFLCSPSQVWAGFSRQTRWPFFVSTDRAVPSGAPRKNHTSVICHLVRPIRDVEPAGHHESVAGAPRRCEFDRARPPGWRKIRERRGMAFPTCVVAEHASF